MKRIFGGIFCMLLAVAMLPVMAYADDSSPVNTTSATAPSQVVDEDGAQDPAIPGTIGSNLNGKVLIAKSDTNASSYVKEDSHAVLVSYELTPVNDYALTDDDDLTTTINVGKKYADRTATIYIQHSDGTTELVKATVASDGTVTVKPKGYCTITVAVSGAEAGTKVETTVTADNSAKSPKTGIDIMMPLMGAAACACGATCIGIISRKKASK